MRLRKKLLIAPALSTVLLIALLGASLWVLNVFSERSRTAEVAMMGRYAKVLKVRSTLNDAHIELYRTMAVINTLGSKKIQEIRTQREALLHRIPAGIEAGDRALDATLAQIMEHQLQAYAHSGDRAIELSTESPNDEAMNNADQDFVSLNQTLNHVMEQVQRRTDLQSKELAADAQEQSTLLIVLGLLAVGACVAFSWVTQQRITRQIGQVIHATQHIADGRLDTQIHTRESDEIGHMVHALSHMVARLRASMEAVHWAADSILSTANEIATGNLDLSLRTESTVTQLQQASADLEQLSTVIHRSAEAAMQANSSADSAAKVAARAGVVVGSVVQTMRAINDSSQEIATIIGVIDGIAFRTNILALNAAVEAARAGEHGRGFAVVASEVRGLAQRCAEAAKEIRELIQASVISVNAGVDQVHNAGRTMNQMVGSVSEVAHLVSQITIAATTQSQGTTRLESAMLHLDHMTQQNAALVEQSAAAAQAMRDQADRLSQVVGQFKL